MHQPISVLTPYQWIIIGKFDSINYQLWTLMVALGFNAAVR
jgi:hypothetical protein